jgi:hypothetical protein
MTAGCDPDDKLLEFIELGEQGSSDRLPIRFELLPADRSSQASCNHSSTLNRSPG